MIKQIVILIDNSYLSIDGDFYPNRLEAQKTAIERLASYLFMTTPQMEMGLISISPQEFGIRTPFAIDSIKITQSLSSINSTQLCSSSANHSGYSTMETKTMLYKGLKTAFIMMNHSRYPPQNNIHHLPMNEVHQMKVIITFLCSNHDLDTNEKVEEIRKIANEKNIVFHFILLGDSVNDKESLRSLTQNSSQSHFAQKQKTTKKSKSRIPKNQVENTKNLLEGQFIDITESSNMILSDIVLSSPIGTGEICTPIPIKQLYKEHPEIYEAVFETLKAYEQNAGDSIDSNVDHQIKEMEKMQASTAKHLNKIKHQQYSSHQVVYHPSDAKQDDNEE